MNYSVMLIVKTAADYQRTSKAKTLKHKIGIVFLSISLNMCYGCSKELSHQESSFEYPQHMFWLMNKKYNFQLHTLIWGPEIIICKQTINVMSSKNMTCSKL